MEAVSREDQRRWLAKVDDMKKSIQSLVEEARQGGHDPVPEAVFDMLDELKAELLEEFQSSRRQVTGRPIRAFHPSVRPAGVIIERWLRQSADSFAWMAAGLRTRLKLT